MSERKDNIVIILNKTVRKLTDLQNKIIRDQKIDFIQLASQIIEIKERLDIIYDLANDFSKIPRFNTSDEVQK